MEYENCNYKKEDEVNIQFDIPPIGKFIRREDGVWDAPNCYECCSDCSGCEEGCECPLDVQGSCNNCIFVNGYKKCTECCSNSRTQDEKYIQMGYWYMCDECIKNIILDRLF